MPMLTKIRRLFSVRTKFDAFLVIYALALGAAERGVHYMQLFPGTMGGVLALACTGAVFVAGGLIIDAVVLKATFVSD